MAERDTISGEGTNPPVALSRRATSIASHLFHRPRPSLALTSGLIVNILFWAAQKRIGNVAYGVSKAATDEMTADMAVELEPHGVAVVSLYPGLVRRKRSWKPQSLLT